MTDDAPGGADDPLVGVAVDGRYEVVRRVARGGMATVYVARDVRLDREVAAGAPPAEALEALADWRRGFTLPDDPQLAEIARAVDLRVRVELARHDLIA